MRISVAVSTQHDAPDHLDRHIGINSSRSIAFFDVVNMYYRNYPFASGGGENQKARVLRVL